MTTTTEDEPMTADPDLLTAAQARVIGALMEKEMVTPGSYPLTLRSLMSACNQTTSRFPVVDYGETMVDTTLHALKAKGLVRFVHPSHGERVTKYRQVLTESLALGPAEQALVALLLLRGPQTVSELRTRSERMHPFEDLDRVEDTLVTLASTEPPLVARIPRQAGQKGDRWIQLLEVDPEGRSGGGAVEDGPPRSDRIDALEQRITRLEARVAALAVALGEDPDEMVTDTDTIEWSADRSVDGERGMDTFDE